MMTLPQIYEMKPKAEYPKTAFVDMILQCLVEREMDDPTWQEVGLKAPTRDTIINWCTGKTKPTNPLYLRALSVALDIPIDKLF